MPERLPDQDCRARGSGKRRRAPPAGGGEAADPHRLGPPTVASKLTLFPERGKAHFRRVGGQLVRLETFCATSLNQQAEEIGDVNIRADQAASASTCVFWERPAGAACLLWRRRRASQASRGQGGPKAPPSQGLGPGHEKICCRSDGGILPTWQWHSNTRVGTAAGGTGEAGFGQHEIVRLLDASSDARCAADICSNNCNTASRSCRCGAWVGGIVIFKTC